MPRAGNVLQGTTPVIVRNQEIVCVLAPALRVEEQTRRFRRNLSVTANPASNPVDKTGTGSHRCDRHSCT